MTIPYDYDQTNVEHLRAVIAEQEQTIKYLHEHCKAEEVENAKLRELVKDIDEVADPFLWEFIGRRMRELGIEVDEWAKF